MANTDDADADSATITHLLEECRMVLPGIQALFGFQLIAIFNQGFRTELTGFEQRLHLLAVVLVVIAVACVMAPQPTIAKPVMFPAHNNLFRFPRVYYSGACSLSWRPSALIFMPSPGLFS